MPSFHIFINCQKARVSIFLLIARSSFRLDTLINEYILKYTIDFSIIIESVDETVEMISREIQDALSNALFELQILISRSDIKFENSSHGMPIFWKVFLSIQHKIFNHVQF